MPNYQRAQPFDIIRTIKALQQQVAAANIRTRPVSAWTEVSYLNSWVGVTGIGIVWRQVYDGCVHISGRATVPSGFTNGQVLGTIGLSTTSRVEVGPAMYYSVSSAVSVGLILLNTSGQLQAFGGMVAGNTFLVDVKIPLDAPAVP